MSRAARRTRRTNAALAEIDREIVAVLEADNPQSIRHVYYRLTDPRLAEPVEKTEAGYQVIVRQCVKLRRSGAVPYGWISDATRRGYHVAEYDGPGDFVRTVAALYRGRLWTADLPHVEVWVESRSLAGVLRDVCRDLAVSLYPAGGFSSLTLAWEAACEIDRRARPRAVILYAGDYDPAGLLIDRSIESELRSHLETPLAFRRLAINPEQIAAFDLPTKPRKAGERRRRDVQGTVEAEAMPAAELRRIVREAVESYLPPGALAVVKAAEESEREGLRSLAEYLDG